MFLDSRKLSTKTIQNWLQHAIAPRPIALASTIDGDGHVNLAPFSFFNLFSAAPPIVVFSPSRRVRDNSIKDTLRNMQEVTQVVINICDYSMIQQVNICSGDYSRGINEFTKAGFTQTPATMILPPMVAEAKIKMECEVLEIKPLGTGGGAGNLVICEVLCIHLCDEILNTDGTMIDPLKLDTVARMGGDYYARINKQNLFAITKSVSRPGVGFENLPLGILNSNILTANHLGMLANCHCIPSRDPDFKCTDISHERAVKLLNLNMINEAWQVLLRCEQYVSQPNHN